MDFPVILTADRINGVRQFQYFVVHPGGTPFRFLKFEDFYMQLHDGQAPMMTVARSCDADWVDLIRDQYGITVCDERDAL